MLQLLTHCSPATPGPNVRCGWHSPAEFAFANLAATASVAKKQKQRSKEIPNMLAEQELWVILVKETCQVQTAQLCAACRPTLLVSSSKSIGIDITIWLRLHPFPILNQGWNWGVKIGEDWHPSNRRLVAENRVVSHSLPGLFSPL